VSCRARLTKLWLLTELDFRCGLNIRGQGARRLFMTQHRRSQRDWLLLRSSRDTSMYHPRRCIVLSGRTNCRVSRWVGSGE
jgi:hypothetical protein